MNQEFSRKKLLSSFSLDSKCKKSDMQSHIEIIDFEAIQFTRIDPQMHQTPKCTT